MLEAWENSQAPIHPVKSDGGRNLPKSRPEKPGGLPKPIKEMTLREYQDFRGLNYSGLNFANQSGQTKSAIPVEVIR